MNILITLPKGNSVYETFFTQKALDEIELLGEVTHNPYDRNFTDEELANALVGVDVVFNGWGTVAYDEKVLKKADKLKLIAYTGGSIAPLVSDELAKRDVIILAGNKVFAESVAEGTLCYILAAQRMLVQNVNVMAEQGWCYDKYFTRGIKKKVIGLVGFGMIAESFAKILQAFDVKIKIYSSYLSKEEAARYNAEVCSLEEVFKSCDIISVHSAMTDKNYHLINKDYLKMMKDNALIVNTARGAVIDEAALTEELQSGRIRAALDVYEVEPPPMDSKLRGLENALLIPHKGGPTLDARELVTLALIEDVKRFKSGVGELDCQISLEYAKFMSNDSKGKK